MVMLGNLTFSVGDMLQLLVMAGACGGIFMEVRQNSKRMDSMEERQDKRIEAIETRQEKHEDRFVSAIEKLGNDFSKFAGELRSVIAVHETRLNYMERDEERCEH